MRSPYDRYRWEGDSSALSDAAKRGEILFSSSQRGGCFQCHGGWNFSGGIRFAGGGVSSREGGPLGGFFNTGVTLYAAPNRGLYEQTHRTEDIGKFRAPTLRNIAVTAPYMHDGSLATLDAVIEHYAAGGKFDQPNKTRILHRFPVSDGEKQDLIKFLKSLTDEELLHDPRWSNPWPVLLSTHGQGQAGGRHVRPLPPTPLRAASELAIPSSARKAHPAAGQDRGGVSQGRCCHSEASRSHRRISRADRCQPSSQTSHPTRS
jgi:hypothetical protein